MTSSSDSNSLSGENRYGFHANLLQNSQKEGVPADFVMTQVAEPIRKLLETTEKAASLKAGNPVYEESVATLKTLYSAINATLKTQALAEKAEKAPSEAIEEPKNFSP